MESGKTKRLYTIRSAAKEVGIPESAIREWLKSGQIRSIKAGKRGKRSYFTLEALDAFIDGTEAAR